MHPIARTVVVALVSAAIAGVGGYALARMSARAIGREPRAAMPEEERPDDDLAREDAVRDCEARLASAEEALARAPSRDHATIDPASLPEATRDVIATPEVARAIDAEVERRIAEHFERERRQREAAWAERRAEMRERLHAMGIDDATIAEVTPTMCAIRDVYRQAWQSRGGGGGDAGVRGGRRELREATRDLREEVETTLGPERMARLEEEGGLRALGGAIECGGESGPPGPMRR